MKTKSCKLSVNVNKLATLRNARGGDVPNLVQCSLDLLKFGAQGITVHPRPDGRHIRTQDVHDLSQVVNKWNAKLSRKKEKIEFNIEGYPSADYMDLVAQTEPDQATLVPDPPEAITSNAGWKLAANERGLSKILAELRGLGVRSSLFVDVFTFDKNEEAALARLHPDRIELYTEAFAKTHGTKSEKKSLAEYARVARAAQKLGIEVNAGHDLSLTNVRALLKAVPEIVECSIGHALISEALYLGFEKTVKSYLREMRAARAKK